MEGQIRLEHHEYWAEGVQSWFNTNRPPDHDHNHVDNREELKAYDPPLAKLVKAYSAKPIGATNARRNGFPGTPEKLRPLNTPTFKWPRTSTTSISVRQGTGQRKRGSRILIRMADFGTQNFASAGLTHTPAPHEHGANDEQVHRRSRIRDPRHRRVLEPISEGER